MALFLFGTLRWPDLLEVIAGETLTAVPAHAPAWQVEIAAIGEYWPILLPGAGADGLLITDLSDTARARLDWYETAFGYVPDEIEVETVDGPQRVQYYRNDSGTGGTGQRWDLDHWVGLHGRRTLLASAEVMRAMGRLSPAEIQARHGYMQARAHGMVMGEATRRPVTVGGGMTTVDVSVASVTYPYEGFHRVEEWRIDHKRFDGGRSGVIQRALSHVTDATTVLPYDPVRDRVLVVEQVRVGPLAKGDPLPWLLEPVAGLIDAGETAQSTALREMEEEAGIQITAEALRFVARYYPSPGGVAQVLHSYVALCDLPDGAAGLHGLDVENEDIRGHLIALDDLIAMIASGEAANAPLILSAQWLALNRDGLRLNA